MRKGGSQQPERKPLRRWTPLLLGMGLSGCMRLGSDLLTDWLMTRVL